MSNIPNNVNATGGGMPVPKIKSTDSKETTSPSPEVSSSNPTAVIANSSDMKEEVATNAGLKSAAEDLPGADAAQD